MKLFRIAQIKDYLAWKAHILIDFTENEVSTTQNGVGEGGTVFFDFDEMKSQLMKNTYWVAPIKMNESELRFLGANTAEALVTKLSIGPFAPINYWDKHRNEL